MRIGHVLALSATLLIAGACKREAPAPATTAAAPAPAVTAPAPPAPPPAASTRDAVFGKPQLDQMLAPVALYPDVLLAQVLMAATYPGDVADAVAWSRAHPEAKGEHAVRQVEGQPWDASVQTLVAFPQVLAMLGQDLGWVQRLGDAFLAQPEDVLASVQRLRRKAQQAGHLRSNEYQVIGLAGSSLPQEATSPNDDGTAAPAYTPDAGEGAYITIEPVDDVYVPSYDPMDVYDP
ncbi:DUF3300 domain-containing protein [Agrilutibacter solisilvae]|uniref:DUF3300 domain-containing protein n=1 Tax=Agrilutibacter solisilvae TaxID=2763317 RepID=A0A975ARB6_9GAMM|nr:DUF3300 domain-containing protein [Lysobacter solisilvae]QSX77108.1 DUF3300 domain-containing protein [Lysobacter solisilvae]